MKLAEMTWPEVDSLPRDLVVVVPLGSCEQHSYHLPFLTDSLLVGAIAEAVEARLQNDVLLLPVQWLGISLHHLTFPGTLSAELDTHVALLCEIAESLLHAGFTTFFFLNGHGGNQETMGLALRQLQADHPEGTFAGASYWDAALDALRSHLETQSYAGHAGEMETSLMLHLFPEQVRDDRLGKDGQWLPPVFAGVTLAWDVGERTDHGGLGDATAASAAKGQRLFAAIVNRLVEVIRALRAGEHLIS